MIKKFNLSKKISYDGAELLSKRVIRVGYVKEFIKKLLDSLDKDYEDGIIGLFEYRRRREEIVELVGDKLIDNLN